MDKNKKLKVAFIHPDLGIGGAERLVLDVAAALKKQNKDVLFITNHFDPSHAFEELKSGEFPVEVIGDWIPRSVFGRFQALCAYIRMVYLILVYVLFLKPKDSAPDVYFVDLIPIAIPFLKWCNLKVVYYCHHPDLLASEPGGFLKKIYRLPIDFLECKATKRADVILVNSEYTASIFRETFPEITKAIQILYPTIAYSYLESVKSLKSRPISNILKEIPAVDRSVVFLSINRFHPAKKLELGIEAMADLKNKISKSDWDRVFFIMAGGYDPQSKINAEYFEQLLNLVKLKNLEQKVIFLKSPSDQLKAELLQSCTCLIYTPVKEHFGIVPLEAMTVSKPVIACNSGGPRETVDHGVTGYLCVPKPDSMAQFMLRIATQNQKKLDEMGENGKRRLMERFSHESFAKCLKIVIADAVKNVDKPKNN